MLSKGDLVRIPANTCIIQIQNELALIERYRYTEKPEIGIFIKYDTGMDAMVFVKNEYCLIHTKDINYISEKSC